MADQTIDAIKVRLGVDTGSIRAGVTEANEQLDKIGSKTRVVRVRVEAVRANTGAQSLHNYMDKARKDAKTGIEVPIMVKANEQGEFGIGKLRSKIAKALAVDGGVNVPIKVKLSTADAAAIRKDISTQIGSVDIYFNWIAKNKPQPPEGGTTAGTGGGGGGGGAGGGGAAAAGSTAPAGRGRQPGESKTQARERNRAEHAARQAQARVDREAIKHADTQQQVLAKELADLKAARDDLVAGMSGETEKPGRSETQKRLDAEVATQRKVAKDADDRASRTTSQQVKERAQRKAERARNAIVELNKERAAEAKRLRTERAGAEPATPTPAAGEPVAAGTGSRPRTSRAKTATGAPATGEATTTPAAASAYEPHKGVPLPGTRFASKRYRTADRPRGFGKDQPYGEGMSAEGGPYMSATGIRGVQGVQELEAQGTRAEDMAAFVAKMQAAGVSPADPEETTGFLRKMKGSARRKAFQRLGPAGAEGDPLDDPQVLAAFLGRLQTMGEHYGGQVDVSEGRVANRLAGARGRKGEGGKAFGGGGIAGTKGTTAGATKMRVEDIEIPTFNQGYVEEAAARVAEMTPDERGYYDIGGKKFRAAGAAQSLGREKFAADEAEALAKRSALQTRLVGVRGPETDEIRKGREQREASDASAAADLNQRRKAIRARLVKAGVPAGVMQERIEAELRGAGQRVAATPTLPPGFKLAGPSQTPLGPPVPAGIGARPEEAYPQRLATRYARMKGITPTESAREVSRFLGGREKPYREYPEGYAEGGVMRHSGVVGKSRTRLTKVGERGEELIESDENGNAEVIPNHKVQGRLNKMADGGGFTFRGKSGFTSRPGNIVSAAGMIQRVFVVNWPAAMQAAAGAPAGGAAGANVQSIVNAINQGFNRAGAAAGGGRAGGGGRGGAGGAGGAGGGAGGGGAAGGGAAGGGGAAAPAFGPGVGRGPRGASLARGRFNERQLELSDIQSQISEAQSLTPVRALSVSFGQITSQLTGRADIQARARRAGRLTTQAESALRAESGERSKLADMLLLERRYRRNVGQLTQKESQALAGLPDEITRQRERVMRANRTAVGKQGAATEAAGGIITPAAAVKNIVAGAAGISVGTLAFSAAYGALNAGIETFVDLAGKAIERGTGYVNVTAAVTKELGEQTRANKGAAIATVALASAQAGLSDAQAESIAPLLQRRALVEGGNAAFADQLDLLRSARQLTSQENRGAAGLPTGPFQPPGGIPGITRSTGGFFGTPINATPSLFEPLQIAGGTSPLQSVIREFLGDSPLTSQLGAAELKTGAEIGKMAQEGALPEELIAASEQLNIFGDTVVAMDEALGKVNSKFDILTENVDEATQKASDWGLKMGGVPDDVIKNFNKLGIAFVDKSTGEGIGGREDLKALGEDILQGNVLPDPKQLIKAMTERIIPAQVAGIKREGAFERNVTLPSQTALRFAAQPQTPFMDPRRFPSQGKVGGIDLGGAGEDYKKAFAAYADVALPAQKAVTEQIEKGRKSLLDMGVPPQLLADITTIGKQIQNIQLGIQQRGLNLQVAEYNNQLRIANRSLRDAKDFMSGLHGESGKTLGALEGQNAALNRQLQLLQMELAQRQINFKLATAGFVAPGTTPEERAARIDAAKQEAAFAQKQLDLQKQIAANQFQTVGIGAGRNVQDLQAQIGLLTAGKALTIDTAAAQAAIEALQEQQNVLVEKAQSYAAQSQKIASLWMNTWTDIQTQSGEFMTGLGTDLADAFEKAGAAFVGAIQNVTDEDNYTPGGGGGGGGGGGRRKAEGYLGYHATPTTMTIGEAAGEEVAILRNPRRVMVGMGGGGGGGMAPIQLQVVITGNSVREEQDLQKLAELTASVVEAKLQRRASMLGLRQT